jgi:hypothetical protein
VNTTGTIEQTELGELQESALALAKYALTREHARGSGWRVELYARAERVLAALGHRGPIRHQPPADGQTECECCGPQDITLTAEPAEIATENLRGRVRAIVINAEVPQGSGPQFYETLNELLTQVLGCTYERREVAEPEPGDGQRL